MTDENDIQQLEISAIIGFDGGTFNSLKLHPNGKDLLYPIGNAIIIQNRTTNKQEFLRGHTNIISCIAVSNSGKYVASGQINHMGFKASTILWDFEKRSIVGKYDIHKVRVEYVIFTCDESYLVSLGGRDDTCVVVFDVQEREPMCGGYANSSNTGLASILTPTNLRGQCFISAGDKTIRLWKIDKSKRKVLPQEITLSKIKRMVYCAVLDEDDYLCYCGTSSGDVAKLVIGYPKDLHLLDTTIPPQFIGCFAKSKGTKKAASGCIAHCYSQGVRCLLLLGNREMIIGAGDGTVEWVKEKDEKHLAQILKSNKNKDPSLPMLTKVRSHDVSACVSSLLRDNDTLLVGTTLCEIFTICLSTWELKLRTTCHTSAIYDISFPPGFSSAFATCSKDSIRVWNTMTSQECLRIHVPNFTPSNVQFQSDGKCIVSSWNDGTIRAFTPLTGKLMFIIHDAHTKGVSAMKMSHDGRKIVSGGLEGQVRLWDITPAKQSLAAVMGFQRGQIAAIDINSTDTEAVSASMDGSCVIWDIEKGLRRTCLYANTLFLTVTYHPSDCQVLTSGTDRKVAYWETYDGSLIRDVEASIAAAVNSIAFSLDGEVFATGGNDQLVKLWLFQKGIITHVGVGHAAIIKSVKFSPDNQNIISVSTDGAIYRWRNPYEGGGEKSRVVEDTVSVHSGSEKATAKDLNECIIEDKLHTCKCSNRQCKCPAVRVRKMKCSCQQQNCKCKITVVEPFASKPTSSAGGDQPGENRQKSNESAEINEGTGDHETKKNLSGRRNSSCTSSGTKKSNVSLSKGSDVRNNLTKKNSSATLEKKCSHTSIRTKPSNTSMKYARGRSLSSTKTSGSICGRGFANN